MMHYYQKNIGDYRRDTMHLTPLEHGIYNLFLDTYYLSEQPLCTNHADLMRTHCLRSADEVSAAENVLKDFFFLTDAGYIQKRCDIEIEAFHTKSKSASESAKARWERVNCERNANAMRTQCEGNANAMRTQCEGNANHKPLTINHEPITNNHKPLNQEDSKPKDKVKNITPAALLQARGVDIKIAEDWTLLRKKKKAAITETALNGIEREAGKAGISLQDALTVCCARGWTGFKAEWMATSSGRRGSETPQPENFADKDYGTGVNPL